MSLIHYRGLNCHLACVVNIAESMGVNHQGAFATLWSETDFDEDPGSHIYVSKRAYAQMEALGVKTDICACASPREAERALSEMPCGEPFLVGMDLFDVPWSPVRRFVHGPHYFFARKRDADGVVCFDPTYGEDGAQMTSGDITAHASEISLVRQTVASPPPTDVRREAREVLRAHPGTREWLLAEIDGCKGADRNGMSPLIKQIDAMVNNRYLFQRFLYPSAPDPDRPFGQGFLSRWEAVKSGLYKASIVRNNERVIGEARALFETVMREETDMAKAMIARPPERP